MKKMKKFEMLTKYLPYLDDDNFGDWVVDRESIGTVDDPIQMPYVNYSDMVNCFVDDVYSFERSNEDMELTCYGDILKENHIEWGLDSMKNADVSSLGSQCIMALIMGAIRSERFCDGALLDFFKSGCILKWLERLKEIEAE